MKTQTFDKMKYDLKGHSRSCKTTFDLCSYGQLLSLFSKELKYQKNKEINAFT